MSEHQEIRGALQQRLEGTPDLPAGLAWEGIGFVPVIGTPYIVPSLLSSSRRMRNVKGAKVVSGSLEVAVVYPGGKGTAALEAMADAIIARFDPPLTVTSNSLRVDITRAQRVGAINDTAPWVRVHVSIGWTCRP